jgi:chromosome partitioning protein
MTVRLCVTNPKGGTGKTTVAINLAGALAEQGRDVLLVDLDPQGNATEGLGFEAAYDAQPPSLYDLLTAPDSVADPASLVHEHAEFDVVPSNIDMLQAEHDLAVGDLLRHVESDEIDVGTDELAPAVPGPSEAIDSAVTLDRALDRIEPAYEYVLLDSPPASGRLADAGIVAAEHMLIPALTEAATERAVELLLDRVLALEQRLGVRIAECGVVANRVETTSEDEQMIEWLETVFPNVPVWEVRKRVALQRAFVRGTSIFGFDDSVDVADTFREIAASLDDQFDLTETHDKQQQQSI